MDEQKTKLRDGYKSFQEGYARAIKNLSALREKEGFWFKIERSNCQVPSKNKIAQRYFFLKRYR